MRLLQKIDDLVYTHTDAKRVIGEYLLENKSDIQYLSMKEIADATFTSKASLVRFAKTLGYNGWKEFLEDFLTEVHYDENHYSNIDPNFPFQAGNTTDEIAANLKTLLIESINDTFDQLNMDDVREAVKILANSDKIAIFAQSPNITIAELFKRKMLTIGKDVYITVQDQGLMSRTLKKGDCAILISYSGNGENRLPTSLISGLKQNEVTIIGITGVGDNYLRKSSDCVLSLSSKERLFTKISTFSTEQSLFYLFDLMYSCYFNLNYDANRDYKIKVSRSLESTRYSKNTDIREEEK